LDNRAVGQTINRGRRTSPRQSQLSVSDSTSLYKHIGSVTTSAPCSIGELQILTFQHLNSFWRNVSDLSMCFKKPWASHCTCITSLCYIHCVSTNDTDV